MKIRAALLATALWSVAGAHPSCASEEVNSLENKITVVEEKIIEPRSSVTVLSWNIETSERTEEGDQRNTHRGWRSQFRIPRLKVSLGDIIEKHKPDIIHIQEARKFVTIHKEEVNSLDPLIIFLKEIGYIVSTEKYNPNDMSSCSYITAIEPSFKVDSYEIRYFTKTPKEPTDRELSLEEIKNNNYGEEWERSAYFTYFKENNKRYCSINVHLAHDLQHRKIASKLLNEWVQDILNTDSKMLFVISGDFNSFPNWGGDEQIKIIADAKILRHETKDLKVYSTNQEIESTFFPFPYDFISKGTKFSPTQKKEFVETLKDLSIENCKRKIGEIFKDKCKGMGGKLDQVFSHGFKLAKSYLVPTPLFGELEKGFTEESVKEYTLKHHDEESPAFASDHQPVISNLIL